MGVDVGDFVAQYLGSFFGVYLASTLKVFFSFYLITISLLSFFYILADIRWNGEPKFWPLIFAVLLFQILVLVHSQITHPQIFGEFYFYRYPSLSPVLFFLTDHINPVVLKIFYQGMVFIGFTYVVFKLYQLKTKRMFFFVLHFLLLGLFHKQGNLYLGLIYFGFLFWMGNKVERVHIKTYGRFILLILFLYIFPSLLNYFTGIFSVENKSRPPIYILSADSLRADRIGKILNGKSITPNIDLFKNESFVFLDHHTTIPRTFPSWADLLTGKFSMSHKIRDMFPSKDEIRRIGSKDFPTLMQILSSHGYKNYAVGSFAGDIFPRANFGFDEVFAPNFNAKVMTVQRTAETQILLLPFLTGALFDSGYYIPEVFGLSTWGDGKRLTKKFAEILDYSGDSPHSITYFSSVIHFPYSPPYPYYKEFTDPNYYGKYKYLKFVDPTQSEKPSEFEISQIRNIFDCSVKAFDDEFGNLIQNLKDRGLYEKSIIILTADHGESLYEDIHGQGHGEHLRGEAVTKVPLMIKFPNGSFESTDRSIPFLGITSSVDIVPSLLDFLKIEYPTEFAGVSLLPNLGKSFWEKERFVYSETGIWFSDLGGHFFQNQRIPYPNILSLHQVVPEEEYQIMITDLIYRDTIAFSKHRAIQTEDYKLIYIPTRAGVVFELYNRKLDPNSTKNLFPGGTIGQKLKDKLYETVVRWERASKAGEYLLPESVVNFKDEIK